MCGCGTEAYGLVVVLVALGYWLNSMILKISSMQNYSMIFCRASYKGMQSNLGPSYPGQSFLGSYMFAVIMKKRITVETVTTSTNENVSLFSKCFLGMEK